AAALAVAAVVLMARAPGTLTSRRGKPIEVPALAAIADAVEPDAVIMARTNPFFFERFFRRNADRLWIPLGLDEHRLRIALRGRRPLGPDGRPTGWVRDVVERPFRREVVARKLDAVLAGGRPLYLARVRLWEVPFAVALDRLLAERFAVEPLG